MNVLLLTQVLPYPPDSGPKIKTFNALKYLAARHQVYLVSFVRFAAEAAGIPELLRHCREVHTVPIRRSALRDGWHFTRSLLTGRPFIITRDESQEMHATIAALLARERFDVVHADQLNMAQYALPLQGVYKVLDAHNAVWTIFEQMWRSSRPGLRRWALGLEWRRLKRYEGQAGRQFDAILAVSEEDRQALIAAGCPPSRFTVVPIAVDTRATLPVERDPEAQAILHVGTMYWPPNIEGILWFVRKVYPLIRQAAPQTEFYIVGARPPAEVAALEQEDPTVHVTGYVADLQPYLRRSAVFVVPVQAGSGMRVKILTAWAWGIPIVSTTIGYAGIPAQPGSHLLIADTPADFAAAVLNVLRDKSLAARLSANGRRYVEERFDWQVACRDLDQAYGDAQG